MLLNDIEESWRTCRSEAQREHLWASLTRPGGLWFQTMHETVKSNSNFDVESWKNNYIIGYCKKGFSADFQSRVMRSYFKCLQIIAELDGTTPTSQLHLVAQEEGIPENFVNDVFHELLNKPLKQAQQKISLTALLINHEHESVPATLTLELIAEGTGMLYPTPQLSLCRDQTFIETENIAAKAMMSNQTSYDVRWSLARQDGESLGHLTSPSMGTAFALGLHHLFTPREELDEIDLKRIGISAAIDKNKTLIPVHALWKKLDPDTVRLADLHTIIVAKGQQEIPPLYLKEKSQPCVIRAETLSQVIEALQAKSYPRRVIRNYECSQCEFLEFRLPGTYGPIASHYQVLPLFRITPNEPTPDSDLGIAEIQRWEDAALKKQITYQAVTLKQIFDEDGLSTMSSRKIAPRLLFLGSPGSGKTALIQYLTWAITQNAFFDRPLVPARVKIRDWQKWAYTNPEAELFDYLAAHYRKLLPENTSAQQWQRWLQQGDVFVLLDGLDEVEQETWFIEALGELMEYTQTPIVLTSRTVSFNQYRQHIRDFHTYWLGPLSDIQRDHYINLYPARHGFDRQQLIEKLNEIESLHGLAVNPLLLSILCFAVDDNQHDNTPATRASLYKRFIERLLLRPKRVEVNYPAEPPGPNDLFFILAHIALQLFSQKQLTFSEDYLRQQMESAVIISGYSPVKPWVNALLKEFVENSGLLRGRRGSSGEANSDYFFMHLTIQEYLAAVALSEHITEKGWNSDINIAGNGLSIRTFVDDQIALDPRWKMVNSFLAELLTSNGIER